MKPNMAANVTKCFNVTNDQYPGSSVVYLATADVAKLKETA